MSEGNAWSQAWLDTQRQYWDTLFDWSKSASQAGLGKTGPGLPGGSMDDWWKSVSGLMPAENKEIYRRIFDAGRNFFETSELFWNVVRDAQETGENWRQSLEQGLEDLKATLQQTASQAMDGWSGFAGGWGLNGDAWQDFMKSLGQSPVHAEAITGFNAGEAWNRLMSMPALGYTREWQEKGQEWGKLAGEYAKASQDYAALLNATNHKAVDLLGHRFTDLAQKGESPATLRGMYDLWVDCGEDAYSALADNDDYLKVQGDLMNSLMRLKKHEQDMVQDVFSALNIPGRRELNTALCRLEETRRELRDLRDQIEDVELENLRHEVAELRAALQSLQGREPAAAARPAPARGTAVRKTAAPARKTTAKSKAAAKKA